MTFPLNKTKIVCTIGPASDSPEILQKMILSGMNVARLNCSHGSFSSHQETIEKIRSASAVTGRRVAIMADLPGPKMRIGYFEQEPVELITGDSFTLTSQDVPGNSKRVSVSFKGLPQVVKQQDMLYLNDGYIQLEVESLSENNVHCKIVAGGELRSRQGVNFPGIDLGIDAFTPFDHECLKFAIENGVDAVSQSFVQTAQDVINVRRAAEKLGGNPFIIAKIERSGTRKHIRGILKAADGIMIARGDLGVEIPIERIALAQKKLISKANLIGKPVITATQMLESMIKNRRPTRAESTDVANAILDGTDCVMLSGESAMGRYPVESVAMLAKIATNVEPYQKIFSIHNELIKRRRKHDDLVLDNLIVLGVDAVLKHVTPSTVIIPTHVDGTSARNVSRFKLSVWITAVSAQKKICQDLMFSYGVFPVHDPDYPENWKTWAENWLKSQGEVAKIVVLTEGPSKEHPYRNNRMEILNLSK